MWDELAVGHKNCGESFRVRDFKTDLLNRVNPGCKRGSRQTMDLENRSPVLSIDHH